jgi:hypothetical protein
MRRLDARQERQDSARSRWMTGRSVRYKRMKNGRAFVAVFVQASADWMLARSAKTSAKSAKTLFYSA